jgi:hypothetical protein
VSAMDAMTFIERMIGHLVWPALILVGLLLFRAQIGERIPRLTRVRAGPFDAEFTEALRDSHDAMGDAQVPPPSPEVEEDRRRLERIAEISPRAAVMEAFTLVDNALKAKLVDLGLAPRISDVRSTQAIIGAQEHGLVGAAEVEVWNNLRALSNTARHEERFDVERKRVFDYIALATALRTLIERAEPPSTSSIRAATP